MARRFRGPAALERLHWHLRAHCYVRRLKSEVLPQLPAKRQVPIPVELSNETEYRLAERDLIAWLRTQPFDLRALEAKVGAALRNERLVQLNHLRRLAGRGKLQSALAWIHDFLESGEPLIAFADHIEVQHALLERFPDAVHVLGDDTVTARDAAMTAFQRADGPQLIVCSLRAAGQGITLTRASNVAFLELDWTPARLAQAEDRCHRIGQADAVTAWYLLAPDTIDETMAELLEHKRGVIGAVTDGHVVESESLVEGVVRALRERDVADRAA
jgi:SNF2 family DNA or RNA helicase